MRTTCPELPIRMKRLRAPEPPIYIGLYTSSKDGRAVEAEPPSSSTTATGQQRQIPLNTSISGSGFSHLGTPISATCSGKSCRGSGWPAQASQGPPGTSSARVIRNSPAAGNPRPAGLSAESQALAGSSQAPAEARIAAAEFELGRCARGDALGLYRDNPGTSAAMPC